MKVSNPRRGAALVIALVLLTVASLLSVLLLQSLTAHARQLQRLPWRLQAEALADAGALRAMARLANAPDYAGETWAIAAVDLQHDFYAARVEIQRAGDSVTVTAHFPDSKWERNHIQVTRKLQIPQ